SSAAALPPRPPVPDRSSCITPPRPPSSTLFPYTTLFRSSPQITFKFRADQGRFLPAIYRRIKLNLNLEILLLVQFQNKNFVDNKWNCILRRFCETVRQNELINRKNLCRYEPKP